MLDEHELEWELFETRTPHIKTGILLSVRLSDKGEYVKKELGKGSLRVYVEIDKNGKALDENSDYENRLWVLPVSLEYLIRVKYNSLVDDKTRTEIFRVVPGIARGGSAERIIEKIRINSDSYRQLEDVLNNENPIIISKEIFEDEFNWFKRLQEILVNNSEFEIFEQDSDL